MKYHRLGGLNNRDVFCHSSGGQKSQVKASARLAPPEGWGRASTPGPFPQLLVVLGAPGLAHGILHESSCHFLCFSVSVSKFPPFYKDTIPIG